MSEYIIRGTIIQNSSKFIENGAVVIRDDRIAAVDEYPNIARDYDVSNVIGSEHHIVQPGFVNTHSHAVQTLFRGAADDLELLDWLNQVILPGEATLTRDELYASCRIGYAEMIDSGITTTNDMLTANHSDAGMKAAYDSGIRGHVGKMLMDRDVPDGMRGDTYEILEEADKLAERYPYGGRIEYSYTPRFIPTCTDELMTNASIHAQERGLMFHTHAAENQNECRYVENLQGKSYIRALHDLKATGDHVILAHAVWTDDEEREILQKTDTKISHNPSSNAKLASGVAPIPDYLHRGLNVGLASDGSPASGGHDFFLEMKLASFLQKGIQLNPTAMKASTVFYLATEGGARALNRSDIGTISVGKRADLVVLDPDHPSGYPRYNPYSFVVYTASNRDVSHVMIDGNFQYYERNFVHDLTPYYETARKYQNERPFESRV